MPLSRTYNSFYNGEKQDDFLTGGANFIELNNLTGLRNGYDLTLGPISEKLFTTGSSKMWGLSVLSRTDGTLSQTYFGGDGGEIYRGTATDDTPTHTLTSTNFIIGMVPFANWIFIFTKTALTTNTGVGVSKISQGNADTDNWAGMDESFVVQGTWSHISTPPTLRYNDILLIGDNGNIRRITTSGVLDTTFSFPESYVMGITLHGATVKVYEDSGKVHYWNGSDTAPSSQQETHIRISSVRQQGGLDYITTEEGDLYVSSGYDYQLISKSKQSRRLNDNSTYESKLNFGPNRNKDNSLVNASDDMFLISQDTQVGIYQYGDLFPGLPKGFHKSITKNNGLETFDDITCIDYYSRENQFLLYGYKTGAGTYGADKIDLANLQTAKDGYAVTDIFTGGTTISKQITKVRLTASYTSGSNYVKIYVRKNNAASWVSLRTINEATDVITRKSITEATGDFIDIQFKVELHNDNQDNTPPIVHELYLEYIINKNNG